MMPLPPGGGNAFSEIGSYFAACRGSSDSAPPAAGEFAVKACGPAKVAYPQLLDNPNADRAGISDSRSRWITMAQLSRRTMPPPRQAPVGTLAALDAETGVPDCRFQLFGRGAGFVVTDIGKAGVERNLRIRHAVDCLQHALHTEHAATAGHATDSY